jgi:hypothetical protein
MRDESRHPLDLAFGCALALISAIDFYTARSLSLVAYVEPHVVTVVQALEVGVSIVCALGVATVIATWALLGRPAHRRVMFAVLALQTVGLTLDVAGLLVSTLFGHRANPIYLLLEAALVHVSTVLLFSAWYAAIDHHRQVARVRGEATHQRFGFPQHSARYPGYEGWVPGFVDYLTFAFTTSSSLGPAEALPLAKPAKLLVTLQVSLSLVILLVLAARAIGLIG